MEKHTLGAGFLLDPLPHISQHRGEYVQPEWDHVSSS